MGCDTRIFLPIDVRIENVSTVMGILAGLKPKKRQISENNTITVCEGVKIEHCGVGSLAACANIFLDHPYTNLIDGELSHYVMYFFEGSDDDPNCRMMCPPSTDFWISVGRGLCKFFGGKIDYNDCDSIDIDESFPKPRHSNRPDDAEWQQFHDAIYDLKPVSLDWKKDKTNNSATVNVKSKEVEEPKVSKEDMAQLAETSILGDLF